MVRVMRYPRMFGFICALTVACALLRDACVSASLDGYARVLLVATIALLLSCLALMSCRFFVNHHGVGVGFLWHIRFASWEDVASIGLVSCNSRRQYIYGMYSGATDFLNMLHHAPGCGPWGFVVPVSRKLLHAIRIYCPYDMDDSPISRKKREGRLRLQWHQAALYALLMAPAVAVSFASGTLMIIYATQTRRMTTVCYLTLGALALFAAGIALLRKLISTFFTCPAFNEQGVSTGACLYLPWEDVRFGYVHKIGRISGMYLLSQPLDAVKARSAPPVLCLSMPDTSTMLLAYLTYCPHASKGLEA